MRHWREHDGVVHCDSGDGIDYTLCGAALEGMNGDQQMIETHEDIDCGRCIGIIRFCKSVRNSEIKMSFQRRAST